MKKIYLYHKISPLGLNYLGKTVNNPFIYKGSGKIWKLHLKKHNIKSEDIKTIILFESFDLNEIKEKGLYYSDLYNIVESDDWANLIPESGEGVLAGTILTEEHKRKIGIATKNRPPYSQETREKLRIAKTGTILSEETKQKISRAHKGKVSYYPTQEIKDKISQSHKGKTKKGVDVISIDGTEKYPSVRELAKILNVNEITLSAHLRKKSNKYPYKYVEGYIPRARKSKNKIVVSEETKEKIRKSKTKKVINTETNEVFESVLVVSRILGIREDTLRARINTQKYKFKYYDKK